VHSFHNKHVNNHVNAEPLTSMLWCVTSQATNIKIPCTRLFIKIQINMIIMSKLTPILTGVKPWLKHPLLRVWQRSRRTVPPVGCSRCDASYWVHCRSHNSRHWTVSWASWIHSTLSDSVSLRSIAISSSISYVSQVVSLRQISRPKFYMQLLSFPLLTLAPRISSFLMTLIRPGWRYKILFMWLSPVSRYFLLSPLCSSILLFLYDHTAEECSSV
jgi:hypothetical protein